MGHQGKYFLSFQGLKSIVDNTVYEAEDETLEINPMARDLLDMDLFISQEIKQEIPEDNNLNEILKDIKVFTKKKLWNPGQNENNVITRLSNLCRSFVCQDQDMNISSVSCISEEQGAVCALAVLDAIKGQRIRQ